MHSVHLYLLTSQHIRDGITEEEEEEEERKKRETSLIYKERNHHRVYKIFLWEVVLGPAFEANLTEGEAKEQPQVPCDHPQPAASSQTTRSEQEDEPWI